MGRKGGRSVYSQPGTREDGNRTTTQRRDSKKVRREFRDGGRDFQARGLSKDWVMLSDIMLILYISYQLCVCRANKELCLGYK
jgi:hypothetical protein